MYLETIYDKHILFKIISSHNGIQLLHFMTLRHSDAYIRQQNIPLLVQKMVCRLIGAKLLRAPMLPYCQLDPKEHISVIFLIQTCTYMEMRFNMSSYIYMYMYIYISTYLGNNQVCCVIDTSVLLCFARKYSYFVKKKSCPNYS